MSEQKIKCEKEIINTMQPQGQVCKIVRSPRREGNDGLQQLERKGSDVLQSLHKGEGTAEVKGEE